MCGDVVDIDVNMLKYQLLMVILYMLNVEIWMWWLHVLNYVVELLHANDGDIDDECMYIWL
jgi:hypothetical protein